MKHRIFVKMCGVDQNGNTGPLDPKTGKTIEGYYPYNGVSITIPGPDAVEELRGPKQYDEKTGERIYQKTIAEVIEEHAVLLANGRPYFIGTVSDIPEDYYFRPAWRYDDSGDMPKVVVDIAEARAVHKAILLNLLRQKLTVLQDPVLALEKDVEAEKAKLVAAYQSVDLSQLTDLQKIKDTIPAELAL